uniref:DM13 domain-containing protein n=1 Tax=Plectus sambesii TaxID=2011161 RepID=A0A914V472_9BILA
MTSFDASSTVILLSCTIKRAKTHSYTAATCGARFFYLSAVNVNDKTAPEPFCCITDAGNPSKGIVGAWYNAGAGPIRVLDAKTLVLPQFTFEGTKPPDGWIYAGRGKVDKDSGKKALVVGRDSSALHCPLREDWTGRQDLTVELGDGQTVYDINYLSVYCFAVGVNFGHVPVNLTPQRNPVPPSIPPVRDGPPPVSRPLRTSC